MRAETKPPGGFDISPEIPAAPDSMAIFRTLCGSASEQRVLLSIRIVPVRDDFQSELRPVETTDGIHQWMNPWNSVATYRRNRQAWGLLIAGLIRSAMSSFRPD